MSPDDDPKDDDRAFPMLGVAVFLVLLVAAGVWMANSIIDMRKAQDCALSGRRNCAPISVPAR
jgi:hypothetical protein